MSRVLVPVGSLIILAMIILLALAFLGPRIGVSLATVLSYHAQVTHYPEAQQIANCLDKNGAIQTWETSDTRFKICLLAGNKQKGKFGLFIEKIHDITQNTAYNSNCTSLKDIQNQLTALKAKLVP